MAKKKQGNTALSWVLGIGATALLVGAIVKKVTGAKTPEPINQVVGWLNEKFGRKWLTVGLAALTKAMPGPLAAFVNVLEAVYEAEEQGTSQGWSGQQKYQYAAARC